MNNQNLSLTKLNLPEFNFKFKKENEKSFVFDETRKRYVSLTPEEWVRQNFIKFLINDKNYPESLMVVEKKIIINHQPQRFDLLIYNRNGQPFLIAEFKSPEIKISQQTFDQVVRYNMALKVEYLIVSNGLQHYICQINYSSKGYEFLKEIPEYNEVSRNDGTGSKKFDT